MIKWDYWAVMPSTVSDVLYMVAQSLPLHKRTHTKHPLKSSSCFIHRGTVCYKKLGWEQPASVSTVSRLYMVLCKLRLAQPSTCPSLQALACPVSLPEFSLFPGFPFTPLNNNIQGNKDTGTHGFSLQWALAWAGGLLLALYVFASASILALPSPSFPSPPSWLCSRIYGNNKSTAETDKGCRRL